MASRPSSTRTALLLFSALLVLALPAGLALPCRAEIDKDARARAKEIKKEWKKADRARKLQLLAELGRLQDATAADFLLEVVKDDENDDTASVAARHLVRQADPKDASSLLKAASRAKTPARQAACLRWLGRYDDETPVKELVKWAETEGEPAVAATLALGESRHEDAANELADLAAKARDKTVRKAATAALLARGDERGVGSLVLLASLEDAAEAAHAAVGGALETKALEKVLARAAAVKLAPGERPHYFASLLGRVRGEESFEAILGALNAIDDDLSPELGWWLIGFSRGAPDLSRARKWLGSSAKDQILNGLRYLQRATEPPADDAAAALAPLLDACLVDSDGEVAMHALLAMAACGAKGEHFAATRKAWFDDKQATRRAAALLSLARDGADDHAGAALAALADETWYVRSAALEALRVLRPKGCAPAVLALAKAEEAGRIFAEAVALLVDLTGEDFGDDLKRWEEWIQAHPDFAPVAGKLETLRGVPYTKSKEKTAATFYGLEILSENVEFALDRSISMIEPVSREPGRPDFERRRDDLLKRRAEVRRLSRDGFLPRFHVAATELSAALDGMSQTAKFGISLFNTETTRYAEAPRTNSLAERKDAFNWMISTDIKGGTDIKAALVSLIERGEADTILLLSDGDPLSLGILEQIARANAFTRVNILVVSIADREKGWLEHYLGILAESHGGMKVQAEPGE